MLQYPRIVKQFYAKPGMPFPRVTLKVIPFPKGPQIHLKPPTKLDGQVNGSFADIFGLNDILCFASDGNFQQLVAIFGNF